MRSSKLLVNFICFRQLFNGATTAHNNEAVVYATKSLDLCKAYRLRSVVKGINGRDCIVLYDSSFGSPDPKLNAIIRGVSYGTNSSNEVKSDVFYIAQQSFKYRHAFASFEHERISKISALYWLHNSTYDYMWYIEDDV